MGSTSPFIVYTSKVSSCMALETDIGRRTWGWSMPTGMTSVALDLTPARSSRSESTTPVHSATP